MSLLDEYRVRNGVTIPAFAIWVALSILIHLALLLGLPKPRTPTSEKPEPPPLTAYLRSAPQAALPLPQPKPPAPVPPPTPPPPAPRLRPPPPPHPAAKPPPPVIALERPSAPQPLDPVPAFKMDTPPLAPIPRVIVAPPVETDLTAFIEARRRARGEVSDTPAAAAERANRGALASAALKQADPITFEPKAPPRSGGLFQIRRRGYDYAEFMFYGWNPNFRRELPQLIEVRKGDNSDIDIAVIRKIIEIIRNHERGDFSWYSKRRGQSITLSARVRDNAGLEDFMMQEFSEELHRYR